MRDLDYDLNEIYELSHNVAVFGSELKAMRAAPPHTYLPIKIRQMELRHDFYESRLRLAKHLFRKFHPDQPRVAAGNSDGGQWTDGACGSPRSGRLRLTNIDFSGVKPTPDTLIPMVKPASPLKPGSRSGRGGGPVILVEPLKQLLQRDSLNSSFRGTAEEATERYNWLLKNADANTVPALHFTPHEFRMEQGPKLETVVVPLLREQAESACPLYGAVQTQAAGKASDYRSAADFGTRVHTIMKENIIHNYSGRLIPERSFLKYTQEAVNDQYSEEGVRYGCWVLSLGHSGESRK